VRARRSFARSVLLPVAAVWLPPASPSCVADFQTETLSHPSPRPSLHSLRRALSSGCSSAADDDADYTVGCADAIRRRGHRSCSRCSASTCARRHMSRFCAAACSSPTVDKDRGDSPHTLATPSPAASVQSQRLRSAAASPGRAGGGWATPARCESENEEARPSSATTLLSIGTPTQCVQPAHSIRLRKEPVRLGWPTLTFAFAVLCFCAAVARRSRRCRVRLNWPVPTSVARRA
jgi:hypothetical protein